MQVSIQLTYKKEFLEGVAATMKMIHMVKSMTWKEHLKIVRKREELGKAECHHQWETTTN